MKYVEIIGSPGSGKTTLLRTLGKTHHSSSCWEVEEKLKHKRLTGRIIKVVKRHLGIKEAKSADYKFLEHGLPRLFAENNQPFFDYCWDNIKTSYIDSWAAIRASKMLYLSTTIVSNVEKIKKEKIFVVDEGFLHRLFHIHPIALYDHHSNNDAMKSDVDAFLNLVPLPKAAIYIDTPPEAILDRRIVRSRRLYSQIKNQQKKPTKNPKNIIAEYNRNKYFLEKLRNKGLPVLTVSGLEDPKINALALTEFLESIAPKLLNLGELCKPKTESA